MYNTKVANSIGIWSSFWYFICLFINTDCMLFVFLCLCSVVIVSNKFFVQNLGAHIPNNFVTAHSVPPLPLIASLEEAPPVLIFEEKLWVSLEWIRFSLFTYIDLSINTVIKETLKTVIYDVFHYSDVTLVLHLDITIRLVHSRSQ